MKKTLINLVLVSIAMVLTILIFQLIQFIRGNEFSIEEFVYALIVGGAIFIIPFFIFFLTFGFIKDKLSEKNAFFIKLPGQLLAGFGLAIACILFLTFVTFMFRELSYTAILEYLTSFIFFVVFVVIVVILNYCYKLYTK